MDVDVEHRKAQLKFYGYIPDANDLRERCFQLMTLISALHTASRSVGFALLLVGGKSLAAIFFAVEMFLYVMYKLARRDFDVWPRIDGRASTVLVVVLSRLMEKLVTDFTGCFHMRHAYSLGGIYFAATMIWSQIFPFVALLLGEDDLKLKGSIPVFLICSACLWLLLNIVFFCTIDLKHIETFYSLKIAPQYVASGRSGRRREDKTRNEAMSYY